MYELIKTYVRLNYEWSVLDASDVVVSELLGAYDTVHVVMHDGEQSHNVIDLYDSSFGQDITRLSQTLSTWVAATSSTDMVMFVSHLDHSKVKRMHVSDLLAYPVKIALGDSTNVADEEVPHGGALDMVITNKPDADKDYVSAMASGCLVAVNDYILPTTLVGKSLFVIDAKPFLSLTKDTAPMVTVLNLSPLGKWVDFEITRENAHVLERRAVDKDRNQTRVIVEVGTLAAGTPLLVLGGQPHFLDGTVTTVDREHVTIIVSHRSVARRGVELPPGVDTYGTTMSGVVDSDFDPIGYLMGPMCRLLLMENDDINRNIRLAGRTGIPGEYTLFQGTDALMVQSNGDMASYYITGRSEHNFALSTTVGMRKNYLSETAGHVPCEGGNQRVDTSPYPDEVRLLALYSTK